MKFLILVFRSMGKRRIRYLKTLRYIEILFYDKNEIRLKEVVEKYKFNPIENSPVYSFSKGVLVKLSKLLTAALAFNIRVNVISLGGILRNQPKEFIRKYIKITLLKKMANEKDMAPAVAFFSSNMASYITGQTLLINGGWSSWWMF